MKPFHVALCGNPNVGKSTLFNALTGLKQHTGNWTGKTVDVASGLVLGLSEPVELIDLPGAYSLLSGSAEEIAASDYLTFEKPDAVIVVCDPGSLERNLNLALQIGQYCPKCILCLNMMDEARRAGIAIDLDKLSSLIGMPVVGVCARREHGVKQLKTQMMQLLLSGQVAEERASIPCEILKSKTLCLLAETIAESCRMDSSAEAQLAALRSLAGDDAFPEKLLSRSSHSDHLTALMNQSKQTLLHEGYTREKIVSAYIAASYEKARQVCEEAVCSSGTARRATEKADQILCQKGIACLFGLCLLAGILYLTIVGANIPSEWLSSVLEQIGTGFETFLLALPISPWVVDFVINGIYRVTAWVVSVMLPPMAIFFPLFTLLEDIGILPRIAFHMDHCFHKCGTCGKQALCMCMGLGCNAVGVTGCRIIQSPRERLVAIVTNALVPCNGRFPALIALITIFFASGGATMQAFTGTLILMLLIVLSVAVTFLCSFILSKTSFQHMTSTFALELPPFRCPKWGEVLIRSILDRTLFVLGRAVSVAAPAGAAVWILSHWMIGETSVMRAAASLLDPLGTLLCMDGVILLAFILGFPANEIVLPLMLMIYQDHGMLMDLQEAASVRTILAANGWTPWTAAAVTIFMLFHWPCSTTLLTIRKETGSLKYTLLGALVPAAVGAGFCLLLSMLFQLFR